MSTVYDDLDDFEFDDNEIVKRMLREQAREELRIASRRRSGPGNKRRWEDDSDDLNDDEYEYEDYDEDYDGYDEDEFDEYAR